MKKFTQNLIYWKNREGLLLTNLLLIFSGNFGKVYKVRSKNTGQIVSLKILNMKKVNCVNNIKDAEREINILNCLSHKNILNFYDAFFYEDQVIIITEYCDGGDLFDKIQKQSMTEDETGHIFLQLLNAVEYLQKNNCLHRDLKPENILLRQNTKYPEVVIAKYATTRCGTIAYGAPEIMNAEVIEKEYDNTCDIWSLGVILYMMLSRRYPFDVENKN
ncbi:CBL-interacting kinase 2-like [Entamoeba marina]